MTGGTPRKVENAASESGPDSAVRLRLPLGGREQGSGAFGQSRMEATVGSTPSGRQAAARSLALDILAELFDIAAQSLGGLAAGGGEDRGRESEEKEEVFHGCFHGSVG